ncbi:MAG TPA: hypothetical protein VM536_18895 [Chloroflexia bacterium]|nr:hypothetical protein [Chloroflexia bacterium]
MKNRTTRTGTAGALEQDESTLTDPWLLQQRAKNQALIALVETWAQEDAQRDPAELAAEWEAFKAALDAERPADQKLFP